jgi:hypothetical protein
LKRVALALLAAWGTLVPGAAVRGEDRVTIRGEYYREPSTRVIQPVVEISKDLPDGFDVSTHYLVDAITSASANAGAVSDNIFTEIRNEVGLGVGKTWDRTRATLSYKYSAESDYWSHTLAGSLARRFWGDTATLALSGGLSLDAVGFRGRTPQCEALGSYSCPLDAVFGGLAYTQVISPVAIAQLNLDSAYLWGFLGNPYRQVPNFGYEVVPDRRLRSAVSLRFAYAFPSSGTGVQLQYRYYRDLYPGTSPSGSDPWGLSAHTVEGRFYQRLSRDLELRLLYRQYVQTRAAFWCDAISNADCYAAGSAFYSTDPKLGPLHTEYPEIKLIWDAESLRPFRFFNWFAAGSFEISYGRYYQNTSFADAHVLQAGYTMPY